MASNFGLKLHSTAPPARTKQPSKPSMYVTRLPLEIRWKSLTILKFSFQVCKTLDSTVQGLGDEPGQAQEHLSFPAGKSHTQSTSPSPPSLCPATLVSVSLLFRLEACLPAGSSIYSILGPWQQAPDLAQQVLSINIC